ncbi:MAG: heterodisulfide reductase-related iron-sulfur binding cluster [Phycisphaeraceae bacterium]
MSSTATESSAGPRVISGLPQPPGELPCAGSPLDLDPRTYRQAQGCVHCGLCLPACPTYTETGLEADSPRGRIMLIKGLADGKLEPTEVVREHLDLCLDCRACETACPSGVVYHELIEEARPKLEERDPAPKSFADRLVRMGVLHLFPHPGRLKLALLPARVVQKLGLWRPLQRVGAKLLPGPLAQMQQLLPKQGRLWERRLGTFYPSTKKQDAPPRRVAFFAGCVGSVLFQDVNRQAIALLQRAGCDVYVPRAQGCCGAIHHHAGEPGPAAELAKANLAAMLDLPGGAPDTIVSDIAGCGAMLREYDHLLRDGDHADRARDFAGRVRDISELLVELRPDPPTHRIERKATYDDACHLAHAQGVTAAPRQMLEQIEGLELAPLPESDICCGAAGTYNLSQPKMARELGERKIEHIRATGARVCITGNAGCAMQIQAEADRLGVELDVVHPVTLLHEACFGRR